MSTRNQVAKLREQVERSQGDLTVQAISRIMDELSAVAAGGGQANRSTALADYFEPQQSNPNPEGNTL
jgi:hypothetical protein